MATFSRFPVQVAWSGSTEPGDPPDGFVWIDTSVTPPIVKIWDGSRWRIIGGYDESLIKHPLLVSDVAPEPPPRGYLWCDTSFQNPVVKVWNGTNWIPISGSGGSQGCNLSYVNLNEVDPDDPITLNLCETGILYFTENNISARIPVIMEQGSVFEMIVSTMKPWTWDTTSTFILRPEMSLQSSPSVPIHLYYKVLKLDNTVVTEMGAISDDVTPGFVLGKGVIFGKYVFGNVRKRKFLHGTSQAYYSSQAPITFFVSSEWVDYNEEYTWEGIGEILAKADYQSDTLYNLYNGFLIIRKIASNVTYPWVFSEY